jgi:hypothetical protein
MIRVHPRLFAEMLDAQMLDTPFAENDLFRDWDDVNHFQRVLGVITTACPMAMIGRNRGCESACDKHPAQVRWCA